MFVVIVGGGRVGSHLAQLLLELNHTVRVVENRPEVIDHLHRELPTEVILEGNPLDPRTLEQAGIRQAHVLVTATADDEINLAAAFLGKQEFAVPRVIGRVNNPRFAWLFSPLMGVDVSLDQADVLSKLIEEEMSLGDMMPLLKLRRGRYSLVEEKVPKGAPAIGVMIKDLNLPNNCVIAAIIRRGEVIVPRGVTAFEAGDEILAVVDRVAATRLAELLRPPHRRSSDEAREQEAETRRQG
jgi:trk system potassium uptake protein TrkA